MLKHMQWMTLACLLALNGPAWAMVNSVAGLANPLESSGASARAQAMGSAFVGLADDSSALFWNAAGLSGLKSTELAMHHASWLADINQETLVLGHPLGAWGGLAASLNYVSYGSLPGYDANGNLLPDYSADRFGFGLGWGKEITRGLSGGVSLKGAMRNLGGNSYSDMSADLGALWVPKPSLRVGLAVNNLGTAVAGYAQATAFRLGASYGMKVSDTNDFIFAASASIEPQGVNRLLYGIEDLMHEVLALRLGYQMNLADNQIGGLTGLTAGIGFIYEEFKLDYAFLPYGDLGTAQRLSLSYQFGPAQKTQRSYP